MVHQGWHGIVLLLAQVCRRCTCLPRQHLGLDLSVLLFGTLISENDNRSNNLAASLHAQGEFASARQRLEEVLELMVDINSRVRVGAFYCDRECGRLFYRHAVQIPQLGEVSISQIELMMTTAADNIEQYYQAFEFVVNGGVCGAEFLDDHVFETYGTA